MKSLIATMAVVLMSPVLSQAETVVYKGALNDKPITLTYETLFPSAIHSIPGGQYNDPEMGTISVAEQFTSEIGTVAVSYLGNTITLANEVEADNLDGRTDFVSLASFEPQLAEGVVSHGLAIDDVMNYSTSRFTLNKAHTQIIGVEFPSELTIYALYYQNASAVAAEYVRFYKQ